MTLAPHAQRRAGLRADLIVLAIYALATWLTDAYFMGDTSGYVVSIHAFVRGHTYTGDNPFWEFGHLLWRPAGYLAFRLLRPLTGIAVGADEELQVMLTLMWVNWLAGLACVLLLRRLLSRVARRAWVVVLVTIIFVMSNAFLDYAQTGCAYVPGLALLLLGLHLLARGGGSVEGDGWRTSLAAGASLAGAVCLWFPYVLVVPAALATPLWLAPSLAERRALRVAWRATLACAAVGALAYGAVLAHLGIRDVASLKAWMEAAGHGYSRTGFARMIFGLARSFINMGQEGMIFKRYMLHDPYSPVALRQLFGESFWQLIVFYVITAALVLRLIRGPAGRRTLLWLMAACLPIFIFALFIFEGGMPERYLPLFPFVFIALACALNDDGDARGPSRVFQHRAPFEYLAFCFALVVVVSNTQAMSKLTLQRGQDEVAARLADLPARLKPQSLVATINLQDELSQFYSDHPFDPINRRAQMKVYSVLTVGSARVVKWREDFARAAQATWSAGGDVWLSRRLFAARPRPEWNWVEGDERRVTWSDLPAFFETFETGDAVGGEDGFVLLPRTPRNEELIDHLAVGGQAESPTTNNFKSIGN